jgi:peptide/nickel transport system permease protein
MTTTTTPTTYPAPLANPTDRLSTRSRRRRWQSGEITLLLSLFCLGMIVAATLTAPWLTPHDPNQQVLAQRLAPPSAAQWLGADQLGRDLLARILYGGRASLWLAALAVLLSGCIGISIGLVAGRNGGLFDEFVMRLVDVLIVFPGIVLALVIAALLKPGFG